MLHNAPVIIINKPENPYSSSRYSVFRLEKPVVDHNVYFRVFEKCDGKKGKKWKDVTKGKVVR